MTGENKTCLAEVKISFENIFRGGNYAKIVIKQGGDSWTGQNLI